MKLFGFGSSAPKQELPWKEITRLEDLAAIEEGSKHRPQVIFKHSTRCSISSMALSRFERSWEGEEPLDIWYLDLIAYRAVSNEIADRFNVTHQSPQAIMIHNGEVRYHNSHNAIDLGDIRNLITS